MRFGATKTKFGSADDGLEALDFFGENATSLRSDAVVAAAWIFLRGAARGLGDESLVDGFSRLS